MRAGADFHSPMFVKTALFALKFYDLGRTAPRGRKACFTKGFSCWLSPFKGFSDLFSLFSAGEQL
jgi:hypothetical protein